MKDTDQESKRDPQILDLALDHIILNAAIKITENPANQNLAAQETDTTNNLKTSLHL